MRWDQRRIVFVTTPNSDPWSGAEELWARTAVEMLARGVSVSASVTEFPQLHPRLLDLQRRGADLWLRPDWYSLRKHPWRRLNSRGKSPIVYELERLLAARLPELVVLSDGNGLPSIDLMELCVGRRIPFITIMHGNRENTWYANDLARRYRQALTVSQRCFFMSEGNRHLSEKQIGGAYTNAEIVRSPVNVSFDVSLSWPPLGPDEEIRFACVGRLFPPAKGHDLLFEALANPVWKDRSWKLYVYGDGDMGDSLRWLVKKLALSDRVVFAGVATVEEIWRANHLLIMPSRFEGLPLVMVEAMLCGRPVVATDVAGHCEVVEDGVTGFLADAPTGNSISTALQRFWDRRVEAEQMGNAGARRIRQLVPRNPAEVFAEKILQIASKSAMN